MTNKIFYTIILAYTAIALLIWITGLFAVTKQSELIEKQANELAELQAAILPEKTEEGNVEETLDMTDGITIETTGFVFDNWDTVPIGMIDICYTDGSITFINDSGEVGRLEIIDGKYEFVGDPKASATVAMWVYEELIQQYYRKEILLQL
jgi:hypothetical protein